MSRTTSTATSSAATRAATPPSVHFCASVLQSPEPAAHAYATDVLGFAELEVGGTDQVTADAAEVVVRDRADGPETSAVVEPSTYQAPSSRSPTNRRPSPPPACSCTGSARPTTPGWCRPPRCASASPG